MNGILQIGLSGMVAAQARMGSAAHNVANASTEAFRRQQVLSTDAGGGEGVRVTLSQASEPGNDLATDVVAQRQALHLYTANLRTVQAADRALGSLLDALG